MNGNCEQHGGIHSDPEAAVMPGNWAVDLKNISVEAGSPIPGERRAHPRYTVEGSAHLHLMSLGIHLESEIVQLGVAGCRLLVLERCAAPIHARVEVVFTVKGAALRCLGTVQWKGEGNLLGIRFEEMAPRRQDQLADVIADLKVDAEAQAAREAAEREAAEAMAAQMAMAGEAESLVVPEPSNAAAPSSTAPHGLAQSDHSRQSRRVYARHDVETLATLFLVNVGSKLSARLLDLSLGGCRIRTEDRFPVGIYTRTEIEFRLAGLPFRLGGVIQTVHDRHTVGVRFLDLSLRKRQQVEQLMAELEKAEGDIGSSDAQPRP